MKIQTVSPQTHIIFTHNSLGTFGDPSKRHYARPMPVRQGEQLSFQLQPGPGIGENLMPYQDLNIPRYNTDDELVQRLKMHLNKVDLKTQAKDECPRNITLEQYWSESQGR